MKLFYAAMLSCYASLCFYLLVQLPMLAQLKHALANLIKAVFGF